ncbi:MAG: hypothetical protein H6671_13200 [Anaerolineaceae bacterium]|nr:hypothetical protein [Anaerolineaceae bacterium]
MRITWVGLLLIVVVASACSGQSSGEQTLVAQRDRLVTQMALVYQTATISSDRMAMTVEYIETVTNRVSVQGTRLAQTLVARGGNISPVQPITTELPGSMVTPPSSSPTALENAVPTPSLTPTDAPQPALYNIVIAGGVGDNDCAVGQATTFTPAAERIYVVATVTNVVPGTELGAHWFMEGQEVAYHTFVPDFPINQECIWFYIDQTDAPFTPGNWSVRLEINGAPADVPANFTITE